MPQAHNDERKKIPRDFYFLKIVGEGSFSTVYLTVEAESKKEYAIKVLRKRQIVRENKMEYVNREKKSLLRLGGPEAVSRFFVHLYATFQDSEHLYFVLTFAQNGELLDHLSKHKTFQISWVKFYSAEILLALEYMKLKNVIHRDLKPENILFDKNFHIMITDFGSSKIVGEKDEIQTENRRRKNSFVGTAQYVSPEVLHAEETGYPCDLWAFGCIIYQMISGQTPFRANSEYLIFQKVTNLDYTFPDDFDVLGKDLIEKLLVLKPDERIGACDSSCIYSSIRSHLFFKETNWDDLGPAPIPSNDCDSSEIVIPNNLKPGLTDEITTRLHLNMLSSSPSSFEVEEEQPPPVRKKSEANNRKITELREEEIRERLELQEEKEEYSKFVDGNLILKKGFLDKKKGTFGFPRKRMFLLTLGPHLYYVDPNSMVLKGEIPFSDNMKTEAKNFKVFHVHTPNRVYYLEDTTGYALEWCKAINEVISHYFPKKN